MNGKDYISKVNQRVDKLYNVKSGNVLIVVVLVVMYGLIVLLKWRDKQEEKKRFNS